MRRSVVLALLTLSACRQGDIVLDAGEPVVSAGRYASTASSPAEPARRAPIRNVLVLTSGGADGAFGAGVLHAWSQSGKRPLFDVVTGTSTGALQATAAFLGPASDHLLERVYTTTRTRDVFRSNGLKTLVGTGLYDPAPLRRLLLELISDDMLDQVAAEHRKGRRLYVATTDMTAGKTMFWDMGAIAASDEDRRSHYVDILVASAAVPGLVEPVRIRDRRSGAVSVHSDGGIKAPVPFENFMLGRAGRGSTIWVLANGHVSRDAAISSSAVTTLALARRGVSQLIRQLLYSSVSEAQSKAAAAGAHFRLVALPETVPEARDPLRFDPDEMRPLFEAGQAAGTRIFGAPASPLSPDATLPRLSSAAARAASAGPAEPAL
ncbi:MULTISPECIES: patatin-like phospholipase family protein [unclassified Bosea (in: a-proteobacteria)]|uniref:patatin-like phospholipase family protein n=1 Tax=unclassified Bosea (in: a-proteobacteria) TaxID=2653178 RepID=UPI0013DF478A|nr:MULTISPECIES: patatin-like phospholipase family protein [unclassified Bosea (in: a-proteobacteria)]